MTWLGRLWRLFSKVSVVFTVIFLCSPINLGIDGNFLIAPNNVIVGNVRDKKENVCHGDKSNPIKARECYPNGKYDFKAGQIVDFTWGVTGLQIGTLVYGIIPARPKD
jgi:hypothetical protein